jgi:hypothetical protein
LNATNPIAIIPNANTMPPMNEVVDHCSLGCGGKGAGVGATVDVVGAIVDVVGFSEEVVVFIVVL